MQNITVLWGASQIRHMLLPLQVQAVTPLCIDLIELLARQTWVIVFQILI